MKNNAGNQKGDIIMMKTITSLLSSKMFITIYEFTEEHGSEHKVPDKVMQQYRYKLENYRHLAVKLADKYVWIKPYEVNEIK